MTATRAPARPRSGTARALGSSRRLLLVVGAAISAFLVFFPARQLVAERIRIARLEHRVEALREENARLDVEVRRLQDPSELELLARERLGLVRPGERPYLLVPQPTPPPTPAPRSSAWSRAWAWLGGLVHGKR